MSRLATALSALLIFAAVPAMAAEAPHGIARDGAWGCRDRGEMLDLLFLGISASFDTKLASALAEGRCVLFNPGEEVVIVETGQRGILQVQRGGAAPAVYWTSARNVK
jgi:hypothetical protein